MCLLIKCSAKWLLTNDITERDYASLLIKYSAKWLLTNDMTERDYVSLLIKYSAKWLLTNDITERDYVQNAKNNLTWQNTVSNASNVQNDG